MVDLVQLFDDSPSELGGDDDAGLYGGHLCVERFAGWQELQGASQ